MARTTKIHDADEAGIDSPSYWFCMLERALRLGDKRRARECRAHLVRLGVDIAEFDLSVTLSIEKEQRGA